MVDIELILGIAIIVVAVITFIRILKPALEGVVVIILIFVGSALIFHSTPIIGLPGYSLPVNIGPNIVGISAGIDNTSNIIIFNADLVSIDSFTASVNNQSLTILDNGTAIAPAKFGVITVKGLHKGEIHLKAYSNLFGINVLASNSTYNYTG
ncbi:MAG: hypothetical protein BJBARM4_0500 [Candidatus Parvarchaeum acidiphilum ARMAN-4]|jgi:hypothetical protein|uniref:Uncharacterized protein n=1 Tax=Candidatus Parvarchaeum acidiphilum ARMAN-4 TaxID=662760 RepID=D2EFI2_PARA4|nr:MAG: hypothetical protein BJBARM4_0500 [Candidatus Parvarchaeum acidiphilum ARMAN-4]